MSELTDSVLFNSVDQVKEYFSLKSSTIDEMIKELRALLIKYKCHPDLNGSNEFDSEDKKILYENIINAMNFLKLPHKANSNEYDSVLKLLNELVKDKSDSTIIDRENKLKENIDIDIKKFESIYYFPKLSTSLLSLIFSMLMFLPDTIYKHVFLKKYINVYSPIFVSLWLLILVLTAIVWAFTSMFKRINYEFKNKLLLESIQNDIFDEFILKRIRRVDNISNCIGVDIEFSKSEFIDFVEVFCKYKYRYFIRKNIFVSILNSLIKQKLIDLSLSEFLTDVILNRMKSKDVIVEKNVRLISEVYSLHLNDDLFNYYQIKSMHFDNNY